MASLVIREARNKSGFNWNVVAASLGVSSQTLYNWRTLKTRVPEFRWQSLARALGVDPDKFNRAEYLKEWSNRPQSAPQDAQAPSAPPVAATPPETAPEPPKSAPAPQVEQSGGWFAGIFTDE